LKKLKKMFYGEAVFEGDQNYQGEQRSPLLIAKTKTQNEQHNRDTRDA